MALKMKQKALAELMILKPELTNVEYAKEIGIDPNTLYKWKKTDEFQAYISELCQDKFKELEKLAIEKLRDNITKGNPYCTSNEVAVIKPFVLQYNIIFLYLPLE